MYCLYGRRLSSALLGSTHSFKAGQFINRYYLATVFATYTCTRANSSNSSINRSEDSTSNTTEEASVINNEKIVSNAEASIESMPEINDATLNINNDSLTRSEKGDSDNTTIREEHKSTLQNHSSSSTSAKIVRHRNQAFINSVTLVGVVHDIQTGYVFEDAVTQFTLTTTSLDTNNPTQECIVEKDHHTIRCFGDVFLQEIKDKLAEGNVVCVNGRLRLNPQLEPSCNKYYYFPYIQVQPPHGQVSVIYGDCRTSPAVTNPKVDEINCDNNDSNNNSSNSSNSNHLGNVKK